MAMIENAADAKERHSSVPTSGADKKKSDPAKCPVRDSKMNWTENRWRRRVKLSKTPQLTPVLAELLRSKWPGARFPMHLEIFDDIGSELLTIRILGAHLDTEVLLNGTEISAGGEAHILASIATEIDKVIQRQATSHLS
jgi:hypothetical protein